MKPFSRKHRLALRVFMSLLIAAIVGVSLESARDRVHLHAVPMQASVFEVGAAEPDHGDQGADVAHFSCEHCLHVAALLAQLMQAKGASLPNPGLFRPGGVASASDAVAADLIRPPIR